MCVPIRNVLDSLKISEEEINMNDLRKTLLLELRQISDNDVNKRELLENFQFT